MKTPILTLFACLLLLYSCNDNKSSQTETDQDNSIEKYENEPVTSNKTENAKSDSEINTRDTVTGNTPHATYSGSKNTPEAIIDKEIQSMSGRYIKTGQETDNSCACYCLDLQTTNSELCLTPSKMYVNIRIAKDNNNTSNIFYVSPSAKNTEGKDIPWAKFDKNTPIATITSNGNGEIELDWLGFSINGDLAIDYAILGKKTLEGNYKKK